MAEITNKQTAKRPRPNGQYYHDEDFLPLSPISTFSSYDPTYGDHNDVIISSRFHGDEGGVPEAVNEDLDALKNAARATLTKRRPIYDWKTTNHTFIDLHNDLRRLGIKNNKFFLRLYDRDLVGVDPFSPHLPLEMQIKIYLECVVNPWYFLREIARIPSPGKPIEPGGGDRYEIDRNNVATWWLFLHHIDSYASKPRQTGKTQDALLKVNYAYHFGSSASSMLLFNKDLMLSKENLARIKDQRDLFPPYLQMKIAFDEESGNPIKESNNITAMKNPVNDNSIKVMPCANSQEMATRLGRGFTAPIMVFDEIDFENFNIDILNASIFAFNKASDNAKKNFSCSSRLLLSTPGDLATRDGKAMTDYIRGTKNTTGMLIWNDRMLDQDPAEISRLVHSPAYNSIVYVEHSWRQLKKSMQWYETQCNSCAYNQEIILREINLQRLAGSNLSPFTREQQLYLSSHKRRPIEEIDVKTKDTLSTVCLYEKFDRRIPYIFGIDPSEGLSEDNNALIVINPFTYKVAAEYKSPYISAKDFSNFIVQFMDEYCPRALLVVEANRGHNLMERLMDTHYRDRIWYDKDRMNQLLTEKRDRYGGIPQSTLERKVMGFVTGTKSRDRLFSCLENMVMENIDCIFSENLVNEILTLIRKPSSGKIEAAPGEHDDCVMAYLIGLYVYLNASNLAEYGISRHMRRPDEKVERTVETEKMYRARVQDALPMIPEQYRGIFEDYLRQRDPIQDARDFERDLRKEEYFGERGRLRPHFDSAGENEYGEENISFDKQGDDPEKRKYGSKFYRMSGPDAGYGRKEDGFHIDDQEDDYMTDQDRLEFEKSIFDLNHPNDIIEQPFDPDDWV